MAGKAISLRTLRASADAQVPPRLGLRIIAVFLLIETLLLALLSLFFPSDAGAATRAEIGISTSGGYARLVFTLAQETEAEVRLSNGIVVITFKQPVEVNVDRINIGAAGYVSAARRDPDGTAIRLALSRKVTVNSMAAGEKLFVDLLPEGWTGLPPGLPHEVVEELARRARDAEKKARQQAMLTARRKMPPVRVRVGVQPTFTRYVFELSELIPIVADRSGDHLTLTFDAPLRFDLGDAQSTLPPTLAAIEQKQGDDNIQVRFAFIGKIDVRTFREDLNYVVDVLAGEAKPAETSLVPAGPGKPTLAAVETVPARAPPAPAKPPEAKLQQPPSPPAAAPKPGERATAPPSPERPATGAPPDKPAAPTAGAVVAGPPAAPEAKPAEPKPAEQKPVEATPAEATPAKPRDPSAPVAAEVRRQADALRISFPFTAPTPAAVFRRADTLWLVFDSMVPIDVTQIAAQSGRMIRSATVTRSREGQVVHLRLDRPKLASLGAEGTVWTVSLGDMVLDPTRPLSVMRIIGGSARASIAVPFDDPQQMHRIADPEIGDTLFVVTALGPARGLIKTQDFVEFRALATTHGVVVQPLADDIAMELVPDKIVVMRPGGLTLSGQGAGIRPAGPPGAPGEPARKTSSYRPLMLDPQLWGFDREAKYLERQAQLVRAAAEAAEPKRNAARLDLARFYLARDLYPEAKGVLDVAAGDERTTAEDPSALVLRALANVMMRRSAEALKELGNPIIGNQHEAPLWRALAYAQQGKWVEAREGFKTLEASISTLPIELQRLAFKEAIRAAIEVRDFADAARLMSEFETIGTPRELEPALEVLKGRVAEGLGRISDALIAYRAAADSWDRPAAAQGRLREIALRYSLGEIKREEAITGLESLTTTWRGDETEVEALQLLARFYTEEARYRDAFHVMRTALAAHPGSDMTRRIHEEAAVTFDSLFLAGKGDAMPAIDALSLFYDFKELTPIGRRGDEMIRKLADRLVSVDLLDQAAALLQHQVDHRLQGAARAQVAIRLSIIYLMGRKPDRAIQTLRATRTGDLPTELRIQRLLIEARALADTGRHDLALEVIANQEGREVQRLRADILWTARRWREAGEEIERLFGERWRDFAPLSDPERADVLRVGMAYALADDKLGLDRFREKYGPKMAEGPDRRAFDVVTTPFGAASTEFTELAKTIAAIDTLEAFLRDMRARFPEVGAVSNGPAPQPAAPPQPAPETRAPARQPAAAAPQPATRRPG